MKWLVLTGFMGAGKSTGGRMLADRCGCAFVDSDAVIEEQAGLPIPRIFAVKGELWFRRMEERVVRDVVQSTPAGVLSVGGGAVESAKTRDLLGRKADVVFLDVPADVLWTRVEGSSRPLAADEGRFMRRFARRAPLYAEVADLTVDATGERDDPLDEIIDWWKARA